MNIHRQFRLAALTMVMFACPPLQAHADSGFYLGLGAGGATIEANVGDASLPILPGRIDEDDTALKVFAGYNFELPVVTLGVEGAYADFGKPDIDYSFGLLTLDTTGLSLWGTAAISLGPLDLYGKAGFLRWDSELNFLGEAVGDDGTDPGFGLGARFNIASFELRGEFEVFDLDGADLQMLSLGVAYHF